MVQYRRWCWRNWYCFIYNWFINILELVVEEEVEMVLVLVEVVVEELELREFLIMELLEQQILEVVVVEEEI
jgi:hypothetical protein